MRYEQLYKELHATRPDYGATLHPELMAEIAQDARRTKCLIDIGCGKGAFLIAMAKYLGYDPAIVLHGIDIVSSDTWLSEEARYAHIRFLEASILSDKSIYHQLSTATCFDVLEHLHRKEVETILRVWRTVFPRGTSLWLIMSTVPAKTPVPGDMKREVKNLHRTIKSYDWWVSEVNKWLSPCFIQKEIKPDRVILAVNLF